MEEVEKRDIYAAVVDGDVELFKSLLKKRNADIPVLYIQQLIEDNNRKPLSWILNLKLNEMLRKCRRHTEKKLFELLRLNHKRVISGDSWIGHFLAVLNDMPFDEIYEALRYGTHFQHRLMFHLREEVGVEILRAYYPNIVAPMEKYNNELRAEYESARGDQILQNIIMSNGLLLPDINFNTQRKKTMEDMTKPYSDFGFTTSDHEEVVEGSAVPHDQLGLLATASRDQENDPFRLVAERKKKSPHHETTYLFEGQSSRGENNHAPLIEEEDDLADETIDFLLLQIREKFFGGKDKYKLALKKRLINPPPQENLVRVISYINFHLEQPIELPPVLADINFSELLSVLDRFWCFDKVEIQALLLHLVGFSGVSLLCFIREQNIDLKLYPRVNDRVELINVYLLNTVLAVMDSSKDPEIVYKAINYALKQGMDPNTKGENGRTLIHEIIMRLGPVNTQNQDLFTPLNCLLKRRADFNAKDADGNTPLHYAVMYRPIVSDEADEAINFADALIQCGAMPDLVNKAGYTAAGPAPTEDHRIVLPSSDEASTLRDHLRSRESLLHTKIDRHSVDGVMRVLDVRHVVENVGHVTKKTSGGVSSIEFTRKLIALHADNFFLKRWFYNSELEEILELNIQYFHQIFLPRVVDGDVLTQTVINKLPQLLEILNELSPAVIRDVLTQRAEHFSACALFYIRRNCTASQMDAYPNVRDAAALIHEETQAFNNRGDLFNALKSAIRSGLDYRDAELRGKVVAANQADALKLLDKCIETGSLDTVSPAAVKHRKKRSAVARIESNTGANDNNAQVDSDEDVEEVEVFVTPVEILRKLYNHIEGDELEQAREIFETGIGVDVKYNGRLWLHWAVTFGAPKIVNYLISHKADVNAVDDDGNAPIHYVSGLEGHYADVLGMLMKAKNIDLNKKDREGKTILDRLVEKQDSTLDTIIFMLVESGKVFVTKANIEQACSQKIKWSLNAPIRRLADFISNANVSSVKSMIQAGINIDLIDSDTQMFPLHLAVIKGNLDVIKLLLEARASLYVKNKFGETPLYVAVSHNKREVFKFLLENGKDKFTGDEKEALCAEVYANKNKPGVPEHEFLDQVKFLIEHNLGAYLLIHAMRNNDTDFAEQLLGLDVNVDVEDEDGATALTWATIFYRTNHVFGRCLEFLKAKDAGAADEAEAAVVDGMLAEIAADRQRLLVEAPVDAVVAESPWVKAYQEVSAAALHQSNSPVVTSTSSRSSEAEEAAAEEAEEAEEAPRARRQSCEATTAAGPAAK